MLKKIYIGLGGALILLYATYSVMGWHVFSASKDRVPTVHSSSSSGYGGRSRTGFWGGGGGGFSFGK